MAQNEENRDLDKFVSFLRQDQKLLEATRNRSLEEPVAMDEAIRYAAEVGARKGFTFSPEDVAKAIRDAAPSEDGNTFILSTGRLGFQNVLVGTSNPTEVMCQYHAPLAFLGEDAL